MTIEVTHSTGDREVMVVYDGDTHEPISVYWWARNPLCLDNSHDAEDSPEVPFYIDQRNTAFHHATNVEEAFAIVKRDFNVSSGDLAEHPWLAECE